KGIPFGLSRRQSEISRTASLGFLQERGGSYPQTGSLRSAFDGDAWRRVDERRLWQIQVSAGSLGRSTREIVYRKSGAATHETHRAIETRRATEAICIRRTDLDQL